MWPKFNGDLQKQVTEPLTEDLKEITDEQFDKKPFYVRWMRWILFASHLISYTIFVSSVIVFLYNAYPILQKALVGDINGVLEANTMPSYRSQFEDFEKKFNKEYKDADERQYRFTVFARNLLEMEEDERQMTGVDLDITQFADWTELEMRRILLRGYTQKIPFEGSTYEGQILETGTKRAENTDWRTTNKVTPVKNQQQCGSCWSFAVVASVESQYAIKKGSLISLSEQELVDCETDQNGCHGGYRPYAFRFVKQTGLVEESVYPYIGQESQQCKLTDQEKKRVFIDDYKMMSTNEETVADWVFKNGPVTFGMNVTKAMYSYRSGVFSPTNEDCQQKSLGSHALTVVGYGTESGKDYWLVKNSWGSTWGENGYFKLLRGYNSCGMANTIVAPVIN